MVTAFFLLEWCLRVRVFGYRWFKDTEHLLDTFIVWSDLFKFFRIARMLRFVQLASAFEDLWKLRPQSVKKQGGSLYLEMLEAKNGRIGFQEFPSTASDGAKEAQQRFKGISASMLTLTRFMHGDDSQAIMDALVEELPFIWIFLWLFTAMSSFVLLNLVTAVIVQHAMDMSKGDEKEMAILRKREQEREMKELEEPAAQMFREIDEDGSGIVSLAEFEEAFKDQAICDKFLMLGLKKEQAMELFSLLDTGGEGELDLSEFMQGMSQLKGVAKNKDMVMLTKGIERLGKGIIRMGESMGVQCKLDGASKMEPLRSSCPFLEQEARLHLSYDVSNSVYLEVQSNEEPLFSYMLRFVSKSVQDARSIRADMGKGRGLGADDDEIDDLLVMVKGKGKVGGASRKRKREVQMPSGNIGLGWHSFDFQWDEGKTSKVTVVLQRIGHPTGDGPSFFTSLVLFVEGADQTPLLKLCQKAADNETKQKANRVSLWRFDTKYHFWSRISRRMARSLDSIVLEEGVKRPLLDDLEWFLKDETRTFYAKHGIPYHRCYLLHGEPGTGKTSFMNSVAGHIQRNLCFIQMDKHMTDDTFRNAMTQLPALSMVVLEDVDALFTNHREADHNNSSLSFSGFLNCLDGLGAPDDVVIFMTTNHPDKLDPAVMRPGRIDLKAEFKKPNKDVASKYFLTFYPGAEDAATAFGTSVGGRIAERKVSMAQLQHFFLACHRHGFDAAKAAQYINDFTFDEPRASLFSSYG
ncbi:BCS1 [Symbiodinium natans]|uniref:BCS1 protein n=1 Tax=Symbiodinium natans TaxID=878477 RepID=A0A812S623_9DINO|nr:BCS1 [Symbiodinium natans]